ncbi:uncharacterized protein TNCV_2711901 [Trichonephila clavipes]|nr:uncharacterized protein TNCV_2711901 [Trichonephila clavipes]
MDDVIITSPSFTEHVDYLNQVVTLLREAGLTLNKDKCHFARDKLKYLGLIISKDGIKTDDNKLHEGFLVTDHVILNHGQVTWSTPELAPPLLTTTPHQREDVSALDRFNVHRCPTRRVFSGTGIELMTCLPWLDTLTTGLPHPKVITDHAALTKLTNGINLSSRMIGGALKLSEFNIEWEHRPGTQNVVADVLSRNPVDNVEGSQISCSALRALAMNSREQLIQEQREDPELGHINYIAIWKIRKMVQLMQLYARVGPRILS